MKDFAKSIRTGNAYGWREKNGHQELYNPNVPFGGHTRGYVEKSKSGYVGAKTNGSIVISKKEFESEEEAKKYVENSKVSNKAIVLKDGNVWVVLYANETKSQEFETEEEAREFAKKVGNSSNTKEEAKTKDEYFKLLKFYQTQGYKTKAGEYNPNGRIKLHKGDDSVDIVLVGNSKVGNANKIFSGKYLDIYDNGLVVAKEGWAFGESFNENTFGRWIDEQIRAKEKTLQECKQMKREFESNY